jgi:hypothetical protein
MYTVEVKANLLQLGKKLEEGVKALLSVACGQWYTL